MSADVIPFPKPKARPVPVIVAPCPLTELANEIAAARERGEPCPIMKQVGAIAELFTGDD